MGKIAPCVSCQYWTCPVFCPPVFCPFSAPFVHSRCFPQGGVFVYISFTQILYNSALPHERKAGYTHLILRLVHAGRARELRGLAGGISRYSGGQLRRSFDRRTMTQEDNCSWILAMRYLYYLAGRIKGARRIYWAMWGELFDATLRSSPIICAWPLYSPLFSQRPSRPLNRSLMLNANELRRRLIAADIVSGNLIRGCDAAQLWEIESLCGASLPSSYVEFMSQFGLSTGRFMRDVDFGTCQ